MKKIIILLYKSIHVVLLYFMDIFRYENSGEKVRMGEKK